MNGEDPKVLVFMDQPFKICDHWCIFPGQ